MTENKRFIYDGLHIRDLHGKIPPILTDNDKIRDKYLNELNELYEENDQLKKELDQFYLLIGRGDWSGLVDLIKDDVE